MKRWWWRLAYTLRAMSPWRRRTQMVPGEVTITLFVDTSGFARDMDAARARLAEAGRLSMDDAQAIADRAVEVFSLGPNASEVLAALAEARRPRRIQMSRQHPWRADNPDAVIVARPSRHGNPFEIGKTYFWVSVEGGPLERKIVTRADAVAVYRSWRAGALYAGVRNPEPLDDIRGRDVACWCPLDEPCHGDVVLELANT